MATRIYKEGNYIIVDDSATNQRSELLASSVRISRDGDNLTSYAITNVFTGVVLHNIEESDIVDANDSAYDDFDVWSKEATGDGNSNAVMHENITSTPLNAGQTFTGGVEDVSGFDSIVVACKTDQDGDMYVDFSTDGTNFDSTLTFTITASTNEVHRIVITRPYARVRFTNSSASNQTYLRLSAMKGSYGALTSTLNTTIQSDADTTVVRPLDFNLLVAEGLYQNRSNFIKDGLTPSISSGAVTQDFWSTAGAYTGFPSVIQEGQVVVSGADVGTLVYTYLASSDDTDYTFASVAINGAGTYNLGHNVWRSNFAYFIASNGTSFNVGNIQLHHRTTTANVFWNIVAGQSQTYCNAYTTPKNAAAYLDRITGNLRGSSSGSIDGYFYYKPLNESPRLRFPFELQFGSLYFDDIDYLIRIPQQTDIMPRIVNSSANNLVGKLSYRFILVKN